MAQEQVYAQSPIHSLRQCVSRKLDTGRLGVTMARAGTGKTAFLVQIGLNALLKDRNVLHVAMGQNTDHVRAWYDTLFDDLVLRYDGENSAMLRTTLPRHLIIQTYAEHILTPDCLQQAVDLYRNHLKFNSDVILLDGFDWEAKPTDKIRSDLESFLSCAKAAGSELWMSAQTHRTEISRHPTKITPPCELFEDLIDIAFFLEPEGRHISVRILKDHDEAEIPETHLLINCDTMSLATDTQQPLKLPPSAYTLLSGGSLGAEAAFGEFAENYGLQEINFSFEGHKTIRSRGIVKLNTEELELGHVSDKYIESQMHRTYPRTPLFQKVLQSIWHQVNTASEVFIVGKIMDDNTVKGGTGWAVELAHYWHKPVYVYDQELNKWFFWQDSAWTKVVDPKITRTRFTGSGTRFLTDQGHKAIQSLFERSFG
jgi:hypothetical protein